MWGSTELLHIFYNHVFCFSKYISGHNLIEKLVSNIKIQPTLSFLSITSRSLGNFDSRSCYIFAILAASNDKTFEPVLKYVQGFSGLAEIFFIPISFLCRIAPSNAINKAVFKRCHHGFYF